jgi:hypothetical protein
MQRCEGYEKVLAEAAAYTPLSLPPALETLPAVRSARVIASKTSHFWETAKCEVAHTSLPIRPSKVRHSDIYLAPGGVHGTETKTS